MPSSYCEWADPTADPAVQCRWQQEVDDADRAYVQGCYPTAAPM